MVFWKGKLPLDSAKFLLHGDELALVNEFKYLGVIITPTLSDEVEMAKRMRSIYASGNALISNFRKCDVHCKIQLFISFCYNIYCCATWASFRMTSYGKVKVAHNDIFRSLMNVPRWESASTLFAQYAVKNLDALVRTAMHSLMTRLLQSKNRLVQAVCRSEVRTHSLIWHRWAVALGVQWNTIQLY